MGWHADGIELLQIGQEIIATRIAVRDTDRPRRLRAGADSGSLKDATSSNDAGERIGKHKRATIRGNSTAGTNDGRSSCHEEPSE